MSSFIIIKNKILSYFPPVDPNIDNIYYESVDSYNKYSSLNPLKPLNDGVYAPEILKTLQTLRILLNSNIDNARFLYELNIFSRSWGKDGYYKKSILNERLVNLIFKMNEEYMHEMELQREREEIKMRKELQKRINFQQQQDMIKYAENISVNYELDKLNDDLVNTLTLKHRAPKLPSKKLSGIHKKKISKRENPEYNLDISKLNIKNS